MSKLQSVTSCDVILNFSSAPGTAILTYLNGYVYYNFWITMIFIQSVHNMSRFPMIMLTKLSFSELNCYRRCLRIDRKPLVHYQFNPIFSRKPRDVRNTRSGNMTSSGETGQHKNKCCLIWYRTSCREKQESSVGMPHPLQMFHGNLAEFGKRSNSVTRSQVSVFFDQWRVSMHMFMLKVTFLRYPYRRLTFLIDNFKRSLKHSCPMNLLKVVSTSE